MQSNNNTSLNGGNATTTGAAVNDPSQQQQQTAPPTNIDVSQLIQQMMTKDRSQQAGILSKDSLRKIHTILEDMKQKGLNQHNNANFKYLHEVLQKQIVAYKRRLQQHQQQLQQQQPQQTQQTQPPSMHPHHISQQQQQPQLQTIHHQQPQLQPQPQYHPQPTYVPIFSPEQKDRLRAQIFAFKFHLTKNEVPPFELLSAVLGMDVSNNLRHYEAKHVPMQQQQQQQQQNVRHVPAAAVAQSRVSPGLAIKTEKMPGSTLQQQQPHQQLTPQQLALQQQQQHRMSAQQGVANGGAPPMNGSGYPPQHAVQQLYSTQKVAENQLLIKPNQMDLKHLYQEREKRIQFKIRVKHLEYKNIIINPNTSQHEKIQATIGMKQLELLRAQKRLRSEILSEIETLDQNRMGSARSQKTKKQLEKEKRQTDRKKRKSEIEEQQKKVAERKKFLLDVTANKKTIKDFYTKNRKKHVDKINSQLATEFEKRARRQKEKEKREKKARLDMLKGNDIEAYKRAIKDTKNDRLNDLITQTDDLLRKLGAQLIQDRAVEETEEHKPHEIKESSGYYKIAHRLTEVIDKQPSFLNGGDLKEYQLQGLQWMVSLYNNRLNGILADEMGLGKTIQTIALLSYLLEYKGNKGPHLIIMPLSTIDNWRIEFEKWCPSLDVVVYGGLPAERKKIQQNQFRTKKFNVVLTQYEFISRKKDMAYLKKIDWNYIIIDEGHRIKNANSKLVTSLQTYKSKHRLLLTGTPLQNDLKELWSLLHFLAPKVFGEFAGFETWFSDGLSDKVDVENEEMYIIINRLHQVLRPFLLRREKADVLSQLPEKVEKVICSDISDLQRKYYQQIKQKALVVNDGKAGQRKVKNFMNPVIQLRKVCNHPFIFLDDWSAHFSDRDLIRASGKFELLDRMLPKLIHTGHKSLIFSQMTQVLDLMEDYFRYKNWKFMRLDGDVKSDERGHLVKSFNHPDSDIYIFILSTRAGGLGLNLQAADTVIIFDSDWNPQQDLQAMARAHRIGQKNPVRVFTLVTATLFEQEVLARANEKRNTEAKIIGAGKFNQNATDSERKELLQKLMETEDADRKYDIPSDESLNEMMARSEEEFELFQKMDEEKAKEEESYWKEKNQPVPPRLLVEKEFPDWLAKSDQTIEEATKERIVDLGRGQRSRTTANYDDGFRDDEFLMSDDEDGFADLDSEASASRSKRRRDEDEEEEEEEEEDEDFGSKSRRSSKRQKKTTTGSKSVGRPRGKKKKTEEEADPLLSTDLQRKLYAVYKSLTQLMSPTDGHWVSGMFMELPDKKAYADYYQVISQPICLGDVRSKIVNCQYSSVQDMQHDISLMVSNAQKYNQEGSVIYNDAVDLMSAFFTGAMSIPGFNFAGMPQSTDSMSNVEDNQQSDLNGLTLDDDALFGDNLF